jgi:hypothetical protein
MVFFSQQAIFAPSSFFTLLGFCASLPFYSSLFYAVRLMKKKMKGTGCMSPFLGS